MVKYDARYKSLSLAHDVTFVFLVNAVLTGIATTVSGHLSSCYLLADPAQVLLICTWFQLVHTDTTLLHLG
jgi:hypothetical protein